MSHTISTLPRPHPLALTPSPSLVPGCPRQPADPTAPQKHVPTHQDVPEGVPSGGNPPLCLYDVPQAGCDMTCIHHSHYPLLWPPHPLEDSSQTSHNGWNTLWGHPSTFGDSTICLRSPPWPGTNHIHPHVTLHCPHVHPSPSLSNSGGDGPYSL